MGIGEQFAGLDMKNLIGGPLSAAAESSIMLAKNTADFINNVGFDAEHKTRSVQFKYTRQEPDPDGNVSSNEMAIDIPLLAIVPIPNLQVDEVNILFDMEVKQSERSESSTDMSAATEGTANFGIFKISIKGSVASHSSNTRSSDNSAKYHVDVRATNHGIPEGLARVLDMMAASVSPNLVSSRGTDASGNELSGKSKERNLKLKKLRSECMQLESAEAAARDTWEAKLKHLKGRADAQRSATRSEIMRKQNENFTKEGDADYATKQPLYEAATKEMEASDLYWDDFSASIKEIIVNAAAAEAPEKKISVLRPKNDAAGHPDITALDDAFAAALDAHVTFTASSKAVADNKIEYNNTIMDIPAA